MNGKRELWDQSKWKGAQGVYNPHIGGKPPNMGVKIIKMWKGDTEQKKHNPRNQSKTDKKNQRKTHHKQNNPPK